MTYLITGDKNLINKELDVLKKNIDVNNIYRFDLRESSVFDLIYAIDSVSIFDDKKLVIVTGFEELDDSDILIKYLNNQNDNILVFISSEKLDNKKKLISEIKKNSKVIDVSNINLDDFIKKSFDGYKISSFNINLLKDYCNNDYERLKNEIDKLKMYKFEEKEILGDDIKLLVKKSFDSNIFDLLNAIDRKDKKSIFNIYYELISNNEDELKILSMLVSNFKLLYKIKELLMYKNEDEIIKILGIKPVRFKILKRQSFHYDKEELLKYIKSLGDIDIGIKSGKIDKKIAMELFLSKL